MANKKGDALIDTVRARAARTSDTVLITENFVLDALNDGQIEIVQRTPRLVDLDKKSTSDIKLATNDTSKDISTLTAAHIGGIWILNGADTRQAGLKYRPLPEFRRKYIPIANQSAGEPTEYTRQGNTIYFNCPVSSDYNDLYLHIDYTAWATALENKNDSTSQLTNSDKGLILFALVEVFDAIALSNPQFEAKALKTRTLFEDWLAKYQEWNEMQLEELYEE